jgi:creatinine amidohydrolase
MGWLQVTGYSIFQDTLADMTWPAVEEAARQNTPLLVPVAVIEQHGPHLPLATDTYGAHLLCRLIKAELARSGVAAVIAPPYYWGINESTAAFPGSFNVSADTMVGTLTQILANCAGWGFRRQFIINHHGDSDHNLSLVRVVQALRALGIEATYVIGGLIGAFLTLDRPGPNGEPAPLTGEAVLRVPDSEATRSAAVRLNKAAFDVHAGERETSLIMRFFPNTLERSVDLGSLPAIPDSPRDFVRAERNGSWRELSPGGYIGDPALATEENGELYVFEAADIAAALAGLLAERTSHEEG